jgi:hypothetical protein
LAKQHIADIADGEEMGSARRDDVEDRHEGKEPRRGGKNRRPLGATGSKEGPLRLASS